jgi:hypothetical protein
MDDTQLWKRFNLTQEEVVAIHAVQEGKCSICDRPLELGKPSVCIDHVHGGDKAGLVRGELCWLCNKAIGLLGDDIKKLYAAISYLAAPPAVEAIGERYGNIGRGAAKHGKARKHNFFRRTENTTGGVLYRCGCRDCNPRPLKLCFAHGQPQINVDNAESVVLK